MTDPATHIARLQAHADDQARIICDKNRAIKALRVENSNLWCARNASQGDTLATPQAIEDARARVMNNLRERAEKAEKERDENGSALSLTRTALENTEALLKRARGERDDAREEAVAYRQERDRLAAMHAQQVKTIAELQRELGLTRPDWVDAPAVLARRESQMDAPPKVWANAGGDIWESGTARAHTAFLRGVTPLYPEETR